MKSHRMDKSWKRQEKQKAFKVPGPYFFIPMRMLNPTREEMLGLLRELRELKYSFHGLAEGGIFICDELAPIVVLGEAPNSVIRQ